MLTIQKLFLQDIKYTVDCPYSKLECLFFHEENSRNLFRKKLVKQSGIYMLKYKHDNRIFYIGKALDLSVRLRDHYNRSSLGSNRLAVFLKMVGWSNISVHIIEFCSETHLDIRENYYIEKYLPTLNRKFSSLYSLKTYRSLSSLLFQRQTLNRVKHPQLNKNFNPKSPLWVYSYPEFNLLNNMPFDNISKFKKLFNLDNRTLYKYIDTYTPYNGYIFLSADIINLKTATEVLSLNVNKKFNGGNFVPPLDQKLILFNSSITPSYKPIKIWVYKSEDLSLVCGIVFHNTQPLRDREKGNQGPVTDSVDNKLNPFKSVSAASSFLKINPSTIKTLLNTKIANSKGYYFFDYPISDDLKKELLLNPNVRDSISKLRIKTWVYDFNLNLINNGPFYSQQNMLKALNLKRVRTINKYKDKGILFKGYYFFSQELDMDMKNKLIENRISSGSSFAKPTRRRIKC